MGYETTFRIKGELDPLFKPFKNSTVKELTRLIENEKTLIMVQCLRVGSNLSVNELKLLLDSITASCTYYLLNLSERWKCYVSEEIAKDGEVFFCGYRYSRRGMCGSCTEYGDEFSYSTILARELLLEATRNVDNSDDSTYLSKRNKIEQLLKEAEETIDSEWNNKFIQFYRNNRDKAEECGDDTPEKCN